MPRVKRTARQAQVERERRNALARARSQATERRDPINNGPEASQPYTLMISTSNRSILNEYNVEIWDDAIESTHCKIPRLCLDGTFKMRYFAVVAHCTPLEVYRHIFEVDTPPRVLPLRPEGVYRLTQRDLIPWSERIAQFSAQDIRTALGRIRALWLSAESERVVPQEEFDSMTTEQRAVYEAGATMTHANHLACIPFSLNSLEDEPESEDDPLDNDEKAYPPLMTVGAVIRLALQTLRAPEGISSLFRRADGHRLWPDIATVRQKIYEMNTSRCLFAPDNGGHEEGQSDILNEYWRDQLSFIALFRAMRRRAQQLESEQASVEVATTWFRLMRLLYKIRREVARHLDPGLRDLPAEVANSMIDAMTGVSVRPYARRGP